MHTVLLIKYTVRRSQVHAAPVMFKIVFLDTTAEIAATAVA